jgi:predicted small integral membrane protein
MAHTEDERDGTTCQPISQMVPSPHDLDPHRYGRVAGCSAGLVTFDDYETNYAFVRHVLSMDTTPPGNALMHQSIASPSLWRAAYALIIAGEGALGFAAGATFLLRHLRSQTACFNRAKGLRAVTAGLGFLV